MDTTLDYEVFSQYSIGERIDWVDSLTLQQVKDRYNHRSVKHFLSKLFSSEKNEYIRYRALEYLSELTLLDVVRYDYTKDFLLEEAKSTGSSFISIIRLKYLFLLYGDDNECYKEFEDDSHEDDVELASEACYRAGLIHLLYRVNQADSNNTISELNHAKKWFDLANGRAENRIDALFFSTTSQYILQLLSFQLDRAEELYISIRQLLWERQLWMLHSDDELLEYKIFRIISNIRLIAHNTSKESSWIDYRKEFSLLCDCFNEILVLDGISKKFIGSINAFTENAVNSLLDKYYVHNLSACEVKIRSILAGTDETDKALKEFLSDLLLRITSQSKKKDDFQILSTIARLSAAFNWISHEQIVFDVEELQKSGSVDLEIQAELAIRYSKEERVNVNSRVTGFAVGDELLKSVRAGLKRQIPNYEPKKFAVFTTVLSDLIRYIYQAETLPKSIFPYLYSDSKTVKESVFHNNLYTYLTSQGNAHNYHYEEADVVGGGRLDIVYREDEITFSIEVKKTDKFTDWKSITDNYVAQAQMYSRPYGKVSFLIVFDISSKVATAPLNDIREQIEILHLEPLYSIKSEHPDYVVAILVPANKVSPSGYTHY